MPVAAHHVACSRLITNEFPFSLSIHPFRGPLTFRACSSLELGCCALSQTKMRTSSSITYQSALSGFMLIALVYWTGSVPIRLMQLIVNSIRNRIECRIIGNHALFALLLFLCRTISTFNSRAHKSFAKPKRFTKIPIARARMCW